jgi:hypothetical protein
MRISAYLDLLHGLQRMLVRDSQVGIKLARTSEGVRGTFAPRAMAEGEYLAVIPLELAFQLPESSSAGVSTITITAPPTATCAHDSSQPLPHNSITVTLWHAVASQSRCGRTSSCHAT